MRESGEEPPSFGDSPGRVWPSVCFCRAVRSLITTLLTACLSRAHRVARPDSTKQRARSARRALRMVQAAMHRQAGRRVAEPPVPVRRTSLRLVAMRQVAGPRAAMRRMAVEQALLNQPQAMARVRRGVHRQAQGVQAPTPTFNLCATRRSSRGAPVTPRASNLVTEGVGQTPSATNQRRASSAPTSSSPVVPSPLPRITPATRSR